MDRMKELEPRITRITTNGSAVPSPLPATIRAAIWARSFIRDIRAIRGFLFFLFGSFGSTADHSD
jgi:hypothetical protein